MEISITVEQGREPVAIMKLKGEINASNFMEVVDKAREIYKNPARCLIVDLSEVPSIQQYGAGRHPQDRVDLQRRAAERGGG